MLTKKKRIEDKVVVPDLNLDDVLGIETYVDVSNSFVGIFSIFFLFKNPVYCFDFLLQKLFHLSKNFDPDMMEDDPPKNLLVSGPEGAGKSHLIKSFAGV